MSSGAASDDEAEYAASRFVPAFRTILEDLARNCLSMEDYPSVLPMPEMAASPTSASRVATSARSSARSSRRGEAGSARKGAGASSRWAKSSLTEGKRTNGPTNLSGGRCMVFMMGGLSFPELKSAREVMKKELRDVVVGSTAFVSAEDFMKDLELLGREDD